MAGLWGDRPVSRCRGSCSKYVGQGCILRPIFNRASSIVEKVQQRRYKRRAGWKPAVQKNEISVSIIDDARSVAVCARREFARDGHRSVRRGGAGGGGRGSRAGRPASRQDQRRGTVRLFDARTRAL